MPAHLVSDDPHPPPAMDHPSLQLVIAREQRRRHRRIGVGIGVGVAAVALLTVLVVVLWPRGVPMPDRFRTEAVTRADVIHEVSATGRVQARSQVDVGAQITGQLATVDADYNDIVTKGQVLATFDTSTLEAQLEEAQAGVRNAKAALAKAKLDRSEAARLLTRSKRLFKQGIEAQEQFESLQSKKDLAEVAVKSAAAQLALQEAGVTLARTNLDHAVIRSPIDGIVISRNVEPGQTVAASLQAPVLFVLAEDLSHMQVLASVDETDIGQVKDGQKATFTVDAFGDHVFPAVVTEVRSNAEIVQNVVTYETLLDVEKTDRQLRPGMTASVKIRTAEVDDTLTVPNAALRFTPPEEEAEAPGKTAVWVLGDGALSRIEVTAGISDGNRTAVQSDTLQAGQEVLVDLTPAGRKAYGLSNAE